MRKNNVTFTNGNRALVITAPRDASAKAILDALEIASPSAVILLFGGAAGLDESRKADLETLFADGVTPVAVELGALIIDGGTQSGVMAMMGKAVAARSGTCQLLGIAPEGKIAHPQISGASTVAILVNGGTIAANEPLQSVRNGWHFSLLKAAEDLQTN